MKDGMTGLIIGVVIGFWIGIAIGSTIIRRSSIRSGVGEYYISTNDYSKQFRWKVCP